MLSDLFTLLAVCPPDADVRSYQRAIMDDNVLSKQTASTRLESWERLHALYALDRGVLLFRALRDSWDVDAEARPLLALLAAVARDGLLRATVEVILETPVGEMVASTAFSDRVRAAYPGRFNESILKKIAGNVASTWTQSGHLNGRSLKTRSVAMCRPVDVAYALLLGYLGEVRGEGLFQTPWARLLDAPSSVLHDQALDAARHGWIEYRQSGGVTDVTFGYLLRKS